MNQKRTFFLISYIALVVLLIFDLILLGCIAVMEGEARKPAGGVVLDPNATDERPGSPH